MKAKLAKHNPFSRISELWRLIPILHFVNLKKSLFFNFGLYMNGYDGYYTRSSVIEIELVQSI
jgi:hypothetical protein